MWFVSSLAARNASALSTLLLSTATATAVFGASQYAGFGHRRSLPADCDDILRRLTPGHAEHAATSAGAVSAPSR